VDVSLLHSFRTVDLSGAERAKAVEVGRHGLTIQRGQSGGLLLPSVPVENDWDTDMFLRQVGRKAGLPTTAWQDDAAKLQTFEAVIIKGDIDADILGDDAAVSAPKFTSEELRRYAEHGRTNILAMVQGATPSYYLPSCSDATVQGIALAVELPTFAAAPQFIRISMRPGLPLQSTLFQLTETAAKWLLSQQLDAGLLSRLTTDVAILYDSAMHGTVGDPDLRGFDPQRRALLVIEHGRYAWTLDASKTAEELLEATAHKAEVLSPHGAGVFSLAADTSRPVFTGTNVPAAQRGPSIRPPAVAGVF
jgi:hypothetical protein